MGKIKCIRTPGNHRLIPESEIFRILAIKPEKIEKSEQIEEKIEKKPEKIEKISSPPALTKEEILDALKPTSLVQRSAFSDLLTAALTLGQFTISDLVCRARCPEGIAKMFCDQLEKLGYIRRINGEKFEFSIMVNL